MKRKKIVELIVNESETNGDGIYFLDESQVEYLADKLIKLLDLHSVNSRFPEKEELEKECELYMDSIIKETDYRDRPIHIKYAFKAGINYLNEFLNGR